ncbi:MAG: TIGR02996 domain-containing protein [Proteobacteria bacterium]|nr:TIGR02996 domain-containing protein [Pseudomonadota bacterium]
MEVEVLGRAVDIPRLIPGLYAEPIGSLGDRVAALIARGPDPRVGRALVRFVDEIPTTASSRFHVWKAIFGALPTMVDRASAADFARFRKKKNEGGGFYPRYFNWLAKLTLPEVAQLDAPAKKRVAALTKVARALGRGKPAAFAVAPAKPTRDAMELDLEPTQAMKVAHDAMRANDHERAMRHLLAAWESTRDDDLANLIDELTLALYPRLDRAPGDHRAWLKREATGAALDVQHLLDARTEGTMSELAMKLGRLLARPADPRIGRLLVKVIDESYGVTNDDYWKASLDLVAKSGSPTCLAELESYTADITRNVSHFPHWRPRQRHTVRVIDDLRARMSSLRPLPTEARAVISRIRAAFPEAPKHPEASLIADIVEAPEDDGPRLVFADWLMERGDALGEWISLQCGLAKDPTNKKLLARQKALIKTNRDRDALVGPLRAIIDNDPTFRRGMLASITARGDDKSDRLLHTHPRLATVEELDLWWVEHDTAISFARSPALVSLRKLRHVHATVFLALAASPLPLVVEHIEIGIGNDQEGPIASADRKLFVDAPGLPHVRTVDVWHEGSPIPAWFLDGALARRLVKIECVESDIDAWRAAIKKRRLSIVVGPSPSK